MTDTATPPIDIVAKAVAGREMIIRGDLWTLQKQFGLSRTALAALLEVSPLTVKAWQHRKAIDRVWRDIAARVYNLVTQGNLVQADLARSSIKIRTLMPLHSAAEQCGLPQEVIGRWVREERIRAEDLGLLGLWLYREDLAAIKALR